jgi:hypothetical protein
MLESFPSSNSYEKQNSDLPSSRAFHERDPSSDRSIDLFQVEEIAEARSDIMAKIFFESVPSAEWRRAVGEVLSKYPKLQEYRPFFENIIRVALERHDALEELWERSGASVSNLPQKRINEGLVEAGSRSAKHLFQMIFGFEPQGDVEVTKGKLSLTFVVDEDDARSAYKERKASGQLLEATPSGFAIPGGEVPVIVTKRDQGDSQAELVTTTHEAEHIRNAILREGRYRAFEEVELRRGSTVLERAARREKENVSIDELAKDELLAQLTYVQLLEGSRSANPELDRRFDEVVADSATSMKALADPNEYYLKRFAAMLPVTEQEKERCERNITRGIDSYFRLWRLQKGAESQKVGNSQLFAKVSSILEQFPLHEWPAVVRLFERRYHS